MAKKATLDLTRAEYEGLCWDVVIDRLKKQEEERHLLLLRSGIKAQVAVEEFLDGAQEEGIL